MEIEREGGSGDYEDDTVITSYKASEVEFFYDHQKEIQQEIDDAIKDMRMSNKDNILSFLEGVFEKEFNDIEKDKIMQMIEKSLSENEIDLSDIDDTTSEALEKNLDSSDVSK